LLMKHGLYTTIEIVESHETVIQKQTKHNDEYEARRPCHKNDIPGIGWATCPVNSMYDTMTHKSQCHDI